MRRALFLFAVLLSACAPVQLDVPADAGQVPKATEARLNERAGINFMYLSDATVVEMYADHKALSWRQTFGVYHASAASRAILTKAFKEVFTNVHVVDGTLAQSHDDVDIVIVPRLTKFGFGNKHPVIDQAQASLTYDVAFFDGRGRYLGQRDYSGQSDPDDVQKDDMRTDLSKIILAMEKAAGEIVATLPGDAVVAQ